MKNFKKLFTFFSLYIAQSIPMSFFATVIPVMMRQENFSLSAIGMLQLIKLPWILKFIWSPLIDSSSTKLSHYKRWIFSSEIIYAIIIFGVSFLDFSLNFNLIMALIILSFVASATQDISTDALAILSFKKKDKGLLNSMQSMGGFGGSMIGGGLLLLIFNSIGWNYLLPILALFILIAIVPIYFFKGEGLDTESMKDKPKAGEYIKFFSQKGIWKQVVFLTTFYSGLIGILAMIKPYLVDLGYDMKEIGIISGVFGTSIGFCTAFLGGFILRNIGIVKARILFATLMIVSTLYFYIMSLSTPTISAIYIGIAMLWGTYGLSAVALNTTAMNCVRRGCEGTDFTVQIVISHLSGILITIFGGKLADIHGYNGLYIFETGLALFSLLFVTFVLNKERIYEPKAVGQV